MPINIFSLLVSVMILGVSALTLYRAERGGATRFLATALIVGAFLEVVESLALSSSGTYLSWKRVAVALEGLLPVLLFFFSMLYARQFSWASTHLISRLLIAVAPLLVIAGFSLSPATLFYSPDFISERMLFLGNPGFTFYIFVFMYLVAALFNLEATFRSALRPEQWQIKFTILGTGTLLGFLVFYYSQGLLYRSINMNLSPLRTLALFVSGLLLVYALRRGSRNIKISLSREMAFRSLVLTIIGSYLLLLGLLGEGLRYFGEASQQIIFFSVFFVGCIILAIILLSEQVKRKIKVSINKNFFDNKYDYRIQWLNFTSRLAETRNNKELDTAILSVFCDTFAMGGAMIFLWSPEQQVYFNRGSYQAGLTDTTLPRQNRIVTYMLTSGWVFNSAYYNPDIEESEIAKISPDGVAFTVPIFVGDELDGFIALLRPINRGEEYTYEDYDLMKTLARQAAFALASANLTEQLSVAREMVAVGKVTAFVMHDLKNLVYGLSLLTANAADYIGEPEFQKDLLGTLNSTVIKMKTLIAKIKELPERPQLKFHETSLLDIASHVVASLPGRDIQLTGRDVLAVADSVELEKVIENLLINALDATEHGGAVSIEVGSSLLAFIRVSDTGCGMTSDFIRSELFAPFKTTKSKGLGIGLFQSRQIIEGHKGRIEVTSTPGAGSVFTVWLPLSGPDYQ